MIRVKICCINSVAEARMAITHGASALGLVSAMPSGPGVISEDQIARIAASVPPSIGSFLLTSLTDPQKIVAQQKRCRVNTLQLVDQLPEGAHRYLRRMLPGISIVQVIHVVGEESIHEAVSVARDVDALLLDSGNPSLPVKELGGTGRTHNWALSAQIVARCGVPVFLAGGLNSDNIAGAIQTVRPFGVDVCTGVRTRGLLDGQKLHTFINQLQ